MKKKKKELSKRRQVQFSLPVQTHESQGSVASSQIHDTSGNTWSTYSTDGPADE
jgi:hypothetical protein